MKIIITVYSGLLRQQIEAEKNRTQTEEYRKTTTWKQRIKDKMEERMMEQLFTEKIISTEPLTIEMGQRHFKGAYAAFQQTYLGIEEKFKVMGYKPDVDFKMELLP